MRLLGIDYGAKHVGLALSDENGEFAFPYDVIDKANDLAEKITAICERENVSKIILGESKTLAGADNPIMSEINKLKEALTKSGNVTVVLEPELYTSVESRRLIGEDEGSDARAAALILKSYLDRRRQN